MKITALAALVMVAGAGASAAELKDPISNNAPETVQICSENGPGAINYFRARNIATQMFAGIGVGIEWHKESSCPTSAVRVGFSTRTPAELMPGALAYALPYEGTHIVIFYDRVQAAVVDPDRATTLMAHVLAHEITHVLEGFSRHSAEGVLKAHWTPADFTQMCWQPLKFADEDIVLIHVGLERRAARRNAQLTTVAVLQHPAGGE
jgi:hypothetical protein